MKTTVWRTVPFLMVGGVLVAAFYLYLHRIVPTKEKIFLGDAIEADPGLISIAQQRGYFRDEGLSVEVSHYPLAADAISALDKGELDLVATYETPVALKLVDGDNDLAVLTSLHRAIRNTGLVVRKDRGIPSIEDLRGRRIGVTQQTRGPFVATSMIRGAGLSVQEVTFVSIDPPDMTKALTIGAVDAVVLWNPYLAQMQKEFSTDKIKVFFPDAYSEFAVLAGKKSRMAQRADAYAKCLRALYRAEQLEGRSPGVNPSIRFGMKLNNVLMTVMQQEAEWYEGIQNRDIPPIDLSRAFYPDFLEKINYELVTLSDSFEREGP